MFGYGDELETGTTGNALAAQERSENQNQRERRMALRSYKEGQNKVYNDLINWDRNLHDHHDHCILCRALYVLGPHPSCTCDCCLIDFHSDKNEYHSREAA